MEPETSSEYGSVEPMTMPQLKRLGTIGMEVIPEMPFGLSQWLADGELIRGIKDLLAKKHREWLAKYSGLEPVETLTVPETPEGSFNEYRSEAIKRRMVHSELGGGIADWSYPACPETKAHVYRINTPIVPERTLACFSRFALDHRFRFNPKQVLTLIESGALDDLVESRIYLYFRLIGDKPAFFRLKNVGRQRNWNISQIVQETVFPENELMVFRNEIF